MRSQAVVIGRLRSQAVVIGRLLCALVLAPGLASAQVPTPLSQLPLAGSLGGADRVPILQACSPTNTNACPSTGYNNALATVTQLLAGPSATPALGSCGSSPGLSSGATDEHGTITTGGTSLTSCTLNWAATKALPPTCLVVANSGGMTPVYTTTTTTLVITTAYTTTPYSYLCQGD